MVVKFFGPNDRTGVIMRPLTPADRRWLKARSTVNHGGPIVTVGPDPAAATNRRTATKTRSA